MPLVVTVELRVGRGANAAPSAEKLLVKFDETSPRNSWKTPAEANGCQTTLPDATLVPTRTPRRPRTLSMSLTVKTHGGTNPGPTGVPTMPVPGMFTGSTEVLDQMNPADGSMNQRLPRS